MFVLGERLARIIGLSIPFSLNADTYFVQSSCRVYCGHWSGWPMRNWGRSLGKFPSVSTDLIGPFIGSCKVEPVAGYIFMVVNCRMAVFATTWRVCMDERVAMAGCTVLSKGVSTRA